MKKIRVLLMALAVFIAVGGAFATNDPPCVYQQQYYRIGGAFLPAGTEGLHYVCIWCPSACTYYLPDPVLQPNNYFPCKTGSYYQIFF